MPFVGTTHLSLCYKSEIMSEEANYDTSADNDKENQSINDKNERKLIFQIIITFSLIIGPIFLPFILLFPNSFSWFSSAKEISIIVSVLFVLISIVYVKLNSR